LAIYITKLWHFWAFARILLDFAGIIRGIDVKIAVQRRLVVQRRSAI